MFFSASKIFWGLCAPSHVILWCSLLAAALLMTRRYRRAGASFAIITAVLFIGIGIVPSYTWLMQPLEHRFDTTKYPTHVDGILTLGGGTEDNIRLARTAMLALRYPEAKVVYSGGDGALIGNTPNVSAEYARRYLLGLGIARERILVEGQSRNTLENLQFTQQLVRPRRGDVWLLATSGYQLPRAMEIAHRLGWNLLAWPTNHTTFDHGTYGYFAVAENLGFLDMAVREWIGLFVYRWSGRSQA